MLGWAKETLSCIDCIFSFHTWSSVCTIHSSWFYHISNKNDSRDNSLLYCTITALKLISRNYLKWLIASFVGGWWVWYGANTACYKQIFSRQNTTRWRKSLRMKPCTNVIKQPVCEAVLWVHGFIIPSFSNQIMPSSGPIK